MDKYKISFYVLMLLMIFLIGFKLCVNLKNEDKNEIKSNLEDVQIGNYIIKKNNNFSYHNTSERNKKIEYIVIHYTGAETSALSYVEFFNNPLSTNASADYFVDYNGDIYQYNLDIDNRYSWAVGGDNENSLGGSLYGIVNNENSISIELCVRSNGAKDANMYGWSFNSVTLEASIELVKHLMEKYGISIDNVIRHYDVNGKLCPGIIGWNEDSGSVNEWEKFKTMISLQ